jgi:pSer/pThr/pTyr-binding forkhead associated (FHA) protein
MITCPNCGRENAENFNFCLDCGYDLKSFREAQASSPPAAAAPAAASAALATEPLSSPEITSEQAHGSTPRAVTAAPMAVSPAPAAPPVLDLSKTAPPSPAFTPMPAPTSPSALAAAPSASTTSGIATTCPKCGTPNPTGNKFCGSCGTRLDGDAPAAIPDAGGGRTMFMHAADMRAMVPEKKCRLIAIDPAGKEGMTFSLKTGETLCGRVNGIILFFEDPFVSPTHCAFSFRDGALTVVDKASLNGVYRRITGEQSLQDGDHLRVGRQLFRFEALQPGASELKRSDGDDAKVWGSPSPAAFGRLVQILDDGRAGETRLLSGDACNLGREQGQIVFPADGFISGRHCSFYVTGKEPRVKDLGSSNGTYVRVRGSATVNHGEFVLVGNQMLRVEIV